MIYIPMELLKDKSNLNKVSEILNKLDNDIKYDGYYNINEAVKELKELKENIIIEKLENGFFNFGA